MLKYTKSLSIPSPIADGPSNFVEGADVNTQFTSSGGRDELLTALAGVTKQTTFITSTGSVPATAGNYRSYEPINATGGGITRTLPDLSSTSTLDYYSITFKKVDVSDNPVVIQTFSGSQYIESLTAPALSPTTTQIVLNNPGESIEIEKVNGVWRITNYFFGNYPAQRSLTLLNSWVYYGSPWAQATYQKGAYGIVRLNGLIKDGTVTPGTTIAVLPVGFRPTANQIVICSNYRNSPAAFHSAEVRVNTSGEIQCMNVLYNSYLSLSNISFNTV